MTEIIASTIKWNETDEPIAVTNVNVLAAMAETDPNETHGTRNWYVTYNGQEYPLKHIVGRAIAHATGEERRTFHTDRGAELVGKLGFTARRRD